MKEMTEGVHEALPIEAYHADRSAISKTGLALLDIAPKLYYYQYFGVGHRPDTPSLRIGRAFHAVLDGSFTEQFAIGPDVKSRNEKTWKAFEALERRICLKPAEAAKACAMAASIREFPPAAEILNMGGRYEVTYCWRDQETGILCKCRPDFISEDGLTVVDFKSAADPTHRVFQASAYRLHYYVSAAFTLDGIFATTGIKPNRYLFFAVSSSPPHLAAVYEATSGEIECEPGLGPVVGEIELGRDFARRNLRRLKTCWKTGKWPGLTEKIQPLGLPYAAQFIDENEDDAFAREGEGEWWT